MPEFIDLKGKKFGRLMVNSIDTSSRGRQLRWNCQCECGNNLNVIGQSLRGGITKSCGCLKREIAKKGSKTHGRSHSPIHRIWCGIKTRCNNPHAWNYKYYGGRGIKICERWNNFSNFYEDMGDRPIGKSIDRIDGNGDYTPENCRWADPAMQMSNTRKNHFISYEGKTKTISQWEMELHICIGDRLRRGWPIEKAFSEPNQRRGFGRTFWMSKGKQRKGKKTKGATHETARA